MMCLTDSERSVSHHSIARAVAEERVRAERRELPRPAECLDCGAPVQWPSDYCGGCLASRFGREE